MRLPTTHFGESQPLTIIVGFYSVQFVVLDLEPPDGVCGLPTMRDLMYVITLVTDPKPSSMSFGGLCWGIGLSMAGNKFGDG